MSVSIYKSIYIIDTHKHSALAKSTIARIVEFLDQDKPPVGVNKASGPGNCNRGQLYSSM